MKAILPIHVKIKPLLDEDAKDGIEHPNGNDQFFITSLSDIKSIINYFPITPEQGIVDWIFNPNKNGYIFLNQYHNIFEINFRQVFDSQYFNGGQKFIETQAKNKEGRDLSKELLNKLIDVINESNPSVSKELITDKIIDAFCVNGICEDEIKRLFGILFS